MSTQFQEKAEAALQARRRKLVGLRQLVECEGIEMRQMRRDEADWPDQAADAEAATVAERLSDGELAELAELEAALARIDAGVYGSCEECEEPISEQRLAVIPEARLCMGCMLERARELGKAA